MDETENKPSPQEVLGSSQEAVVPSTREQAIIEHAAQNLMAKIEAKNDELDGEFAIPFGEDERKIYIFRTPVSQGDGNERVDNYLIVTQRGLRQIQALGTRQAIMDEIGNILRATSDPAVRDYKSSIGLENGFGGFRRRGNHAAVGEILVIADKSITPEGIKIGGMDQSYDSVKLFEPMDPSLVVDIIRINREEAETKKRENDQKRDQRYQEEEQRTANRLKVLQAVDELLD